MYSQARGWPTARYIETGESSALAFLPAPDGLVVGAPSRAATAKAARAGAALALLRDLAPPAWSQTRDSERTAADRSPVTVLNERAQTGVISDLSYQHDASGPPHAPVFTCTVGCAYATGSYACAAEGRTKNEAKTAAAAGLLDQITEQERSAAAQLARAAEAEARSARGIFRRLLRAGCALDFSDRRFEVTGPAGAALEGPLAGFTVPLLEALSVLATLDGPAADGSAALLHESARAWARRPVRPGSGRRAARIPGARRRRPRLLAPRGVSGRRRLHGRGRRGAAAAAGGAAGDRGPALRGPCPPARRRRRGMGQPLRRGRRPDVGSGHVPAGPAARVRRVAADRRAARTCCAARPATGRRSTGSAATARSAAGTPPSCAARQGTGSRRTASRSNGRLAWSGASARARSRGHGERLV